MNKTCCRCSKTKPASEYYRQAASKDGLLPHCKACHKRDYPDRSWNKTDPGRASSRAAARRWYASNPEKNRAHNKLRYHMLMGHVLKPSNCAACGATSKLDAHHHDYTKALDVEWLCRACHRRLHADEKAE